MCLVLVAVGVAPGHPLVVAANRDEFYSRPTRTAHRWDAPDMIAGRDRQGGGTWFAVDPRGRFAAVTNFRSAAHRANHASSRGELVTRWMTFAGDAAGFAAALVEQPDRYAPYNLLFGDVSGLFYFNNREHRLHAVDAGIHGLSNADLDTPWPKVVDGRRRLAEALRDSAPAVDRLFDLLAHDAIYPDHRLPDTGVSLARERALSALYISDGDYGTRSSTVLTVNSAREAYFEERNHAGSFDGPVRPVHRFTINPD